ncbi:cytochrome c biogenesis protein ResB [bacterium]|nr:cytochrome c biogenesis protein ResB [bacterium]
MKKKSASHKPTWWAMLSTMKFAIWILIALSILSLASLFANELIDPQWLNTEPNDALSLVGQFLYSALEMTDPFRSWWYRGLIGLLSLSLLACIIERTPIVWRMWSKRPLSDVNWANEQTAPIILTTTEPVAPLRERLSKHFGWRLQTDSLWVGESGRLALWGPLLTHLGLLFLAIGGLAGSFDEIDTRNGGYAGDIVTVEEMPFSVRIDSFNVEFYPLQPGQWVLCEGEWIGRLIERDGPDAWKVEQHLSESESETETRLFSLQDMEISNDWDLRNAQGNVKQYVSHVTIIEDGQEIDKREISVNSPLRRKGFRLYQSSFDADAPRVRANYRSLTVNVSDSTGQLVKQASLRAGESLQMPGDSIRITAGRLLPDFKLDGNRRAYSASASFKNPAVELMADGVQGYRKTLWCFLQMEGHSTTAGAYRYEVRDVEGGESTMDIATIFEIRHSPGTEFLWLGFAISSLGLILCFYITHRVVYVETPNERHPKTRVIAMSRKMQRIFEQDLARIANRPGHEITMSVRPDVDA